MSSDVAGSGSGRKSIGTGRSGPIRRALLAMLEDARGRGRMTPEHELTGALAGKVAAMVDTAARDGDGAAMLRAISQLRDMIDTLPIREVRGPGGEHDGAADEPAEIRLLHAGPTLGDTADT